jgi:hypothetical protein
MRIQTLSEDSYGNIKYTEYIINTDQIVSIAKPFQYAHLKGCYRINMTGDNDFVVDSNTAIKIMNAIGEDF